MKTLSLSSLRTQTKATDFSHFVGCLGLMLTLACLNTQAAVVLSDNLSVNSGGTFPTSSELFYAQQFRTDGQTYTLDSVTLLMNRVGIGDPVIQVRGDNGGVPGSILGSLGLPQSYQDGANDGPVAQTVFSGAGIFLPANSAYWVVLGSQGSAVFNWSFASGQGHTGDGFSPSWAQSFDSGSSWVLPFGSPYQMRVEAIVAVPEPGLSAAIMVGVMVTGYAGLRMRRSKRAT
jgi:hypothetical protein